MTTVYKFKAYYTDAGVGTAQDPAPTCTVINMADDSKLADAQATTASTNMPGLYSYEYSGADGLDCVAWFKTTDTGCDVKQLASYVSEKITTNLNADVAGVETKLDTVDSNVDAILADTGTDGVVLKAAGLNADAVTKIQNGLALEATLTAIKGAGWNAQTLTNLYNAVGQASDNAEAAYNMIVAAMGATWTNQTLEKIVSDIAAISAGATAQEVWEYATRVLTAGTNIDLSALATAANLATVDTVVDAIKAKTDTIPASPAQAGEYTAAIAAIPTTPLLAANYTAPDNARIAAIKAKTDALDNSAVTFVTAVSGSTITILRGDTFSGVLTNIGALTDYVSIDFTVKEAYSKTDNEATIRIRKNASGTDDGLMRLNGAAALSSALGSIAIDDLASGDITITLDETATDDLSTGNYVYDIQMISASGVKTLTYGKLIVTADVTRLVA